MRLPLRPSPPSTARFLAALLLGSIAAAAHAQNYTSIVVFGDSLSDIGNVAHLTQAKYGVRVPGPVADYTDGRFTDGFDTAPAAHHYTGVWVEQLAAMLPSHPTVKNSLDGGADYAYGFATTGSGTSVLNLTSTTSVVVNNIGQQITTYLATHPRITNKTLFIVWGGAIDLLYATSTEDVIDAALNQTANIQRLIDAGATQFLIPNLPPLGAVPRLNTSPATSIPATAATILYNDLLKTGVNLLRDFNFFRRLNLYQLDTFALFDRILANPAAYGLRNVTDQSQLNLAVNPDTYLFWDDLHPTTRGHNLLALTAIALINQHPSQNLLTASGQSASPH